MSRFKTYIFKTNNVKSSNVGASGLGIPKAIKIKSTGIRAYNQDLLIQKINMISEYLEKEQSVNIDNKRIDNILSMAQ